MSDTTQHAEPTTQTLDVPGASLAWDIRPNDQSDLPILLMVGYPMGAGGFATQASHFTDRTVVTYDPRGIERSTIDADASTQVSMVEHNIEDLHAVVEAINAHLDGRPIEVFASSGGAVTALALVAAYPDDVTTVVAHEPPLLAVLEDREAAEAAWLAVHGTYMSRGGGAGMAHFIAMTMHEGPFPDDWASQPGPDPTMFGMPSDDDGSRDDPLLSQDDTGVPHHELDHDAIAAAPTRVVLAAGEETGNTMTARTSAGVADRLGTELVMFPSDHGGFLGGEYGQVGKPDEFAAKLREVLDGA